MFPVVMLREPAIEVHVAATDPVDVAVAVNV